MPTSLACTRTERTEQWLIKQKSQDELSLVDSHFNH